MFQLATNAFAQGQSTGTASGGGWEMFILPVFIILIFYFLLIRPSQKKEKDRKKMIEQLQKGDKVITSGGIYGIVVNIKEGEDVVVLKIADGAKVEFVKGSIQAKVS